MRVRSVFLIGLFGCGSVTGDPPDAKTADSPGGGSDTAATCATVPPGLKARYRAENNANDATGMFNGTAMGANFSFTPGKYGSAFLLDGVDDVVAVSDGDQLWPSGALTLEAWMKSTRPPAANTSAAIICKYACGDQCPQSGMSLAYFCMYLDAMGKIGFDFRPDASDVTSTVTSPNVVTDGNWHHLVGVRDAAAMMQLLYIDGALAVSSNPAAVQFGPMTNLDSNEDLVGIGANVKAGLTTFEGFLTGAIDEAAIYHSALTASEISAIYAAPDGKCP